MDLTGSTRLLKALGDDNRLRILNLLSREELSGSDLMEVLNLGQSRVSTHLNLMKEVGLVSDRRVGRRSLYSVVEGAALLGTALESCTGTPEFVADVAGLEALLDRRRDETRSYFDRVAAQFGEEILPGRTWEGLCRSLIKLLPPGRYADLGIGDGLLTLMLAEVAEQVTAVDLSAEMLAHLEQRASKRGFDNIELVQGELDELPLEDEDYDVVVLSQALHHAERPERALAESVRITRPGGKVLVIDLLAHSEDWVREKLQDRHQGFTEAALQGLLASAGLEQVSVQRVARDPHPPHFMTLVAVGARPAKSRANSPKRSRSSRKTATS